MFNQNALCLNQGQMELGLYYVTPNFTSLQKDKVNKFNGSEFCPSS